MEITFRCPHCKSELSFDDLSKDSSPCPMCHHEIPLKLTERMRQENIVDQCAICGLDKLYEQKDFNRTFGITLFLVAAVICVVLCWKNLVIWGYGVLVAAAVFDFLLYRYLSNVVICYRCHSQYRKYSSKSEIPAFELGLLEKFDPLDKKAGAENPAAGWKER
jgi:uncharacterized protein YbaR (Trm112 family)